MRKALGPFENTAIRAYRGWFVDLTELATGISRLGDFRQVLEIGAGDGVLCLRLSEAMPEAEIVGIDIADEPGAMFTGDTGRVSFEQTPAEELVERGQHFDLVVISDVLHHVPSGDRAGLLQTARQLLAPGGTLVVKDWERTPGPAQVTAFVSDRYISGDRGVAFMTLPEMRDLLTEAVPGRLCAEYRVPRAATTCSSPCASTDAARSAPVRLAGGAGPGPGPCAPAAPRRPPAGSGPPGGGPRRVPWGPG